MWQVKIGATAAGGGRGEKLIERKITLEVIRNEGALHINALHSQLCGITWQRGRAIETAIKRRGDRTVARSCEQKKTERENN